MRAASGEAAPPPAGLGLLLLLRRTSPLIIGTEFVEQQPGSETCGDFNVIAVWGRRCCTGLLNHH